MGFVPFVIGTCVVLYVLTLLASGGSIGTGGLFSVLSSLPSLFLFGASGGVPVFRIRSMVDSPERCVAARRGAPHSVQHDGAASARAGRRGTIWTGQDGDHLHRCGGLRLYAEPAVFFPSIPFLRGSSFTIGASASIAGLIGAILHYGHRSGSSLARSYATSYALMLVFIGFFMTGIDNYAHAGGFEEAISQRACSISSPERIDHMVIAVGCLVASILSIVASVVLDCLP